MKGEGSVQVERMAAGKYVDGVRWLPSVAAMERNVVVAGSSSGDCFSSCCIELHSLSPTAPSLNLVASCAVPVRISTLKVAPSIIAASSSSGHLLFLTPNPLLTVSSSHLGGGISAMDLEASTPTFQCVAVGEDGRVNVVSLVEGQAEAHCRQIFDNRGLMSYTAACWASPTEFVTAGLGLGLPLHWWDLRTPSATAPAVSLNWAGNKTARVIHSIDVHPSRKHLCVVGGSSGLVFAWDLRWQQEPIPLVDTGSSSRKISELLSESEVWEVKFDHYTQSTSFGAASSKIPPVMMCSEDGILAVFESGEAPLEVLAEPCAINTFDIDPENSSDVICGLEWETILFLRRS
ncbi:hypothetical protein SUGI_0252720 [Cryptomeria japonica]|uniref:nuclear pore complex protein NUP43 n=1 Tax=Cryptomeria japonica TaxID=3369 RepID=UPI002408999E|nr:nuclear pore complex protein NUP43 [Cryptomeria japonica]GLJ15396.1 hypothetical protein SUGI_0252720 [Cryptomeria japonica]